MIQDHITIESGQKVEIVRAHVAQLAAAAGMCVRDWRVAFSELEASGFVTRRGSPVGRSQIFLFARPESASTFGGVLILDFNRIRVRGRTA